MHVMSIAQLDPAPPPGEDAPVDRVTAAASKFAEYGIRRSTIEISRAAPPSRR